MSRYNRYLQTFSLVTCIFLRGMTTLNCMNAYGSFIIILIKHIFSHKPLCIINWWNIKVAAVRKIVRWPKIFKYTQAYIFFIQWLEQIIHIYPKIKKITSAKIALKRVVSPLNKDISTMRWDWFIRVCGFRWCG